MKKAEVFVHNRRAGILEEKEPGTSYRFKYDKFYEGPPVSLTLPVNTSEFEFDMFPAFFEGFLPEGRRLEAFLLTTKIDRHDLFSQLIAVGKNMVGIVTVRALNRISY